MPTWSASRPPLGPTRPETLGRVNSFLAKLQRVPEREMRILLVREALLEASPAVAIDIVAATIEHCLVGEPPGEDGVLALVPCLLDIDDDDALYGRLSDLYATAVAARDGVSPDASLEDAEDNGAERDEPAVSPTTVEAEAQRQGARRRFDVAARLLLNPPAHRKPPARTERFAPRWERPVTLGERKAFATGRNRLFLERLLYDAEVPVIARLCRNPRITEQDILLVVTRRPNHRLVLAEVARSPWLSRYAVRHALVLNPYAGTGLVLRLLPLLHEQHLAALRYIGDVHPLVREAAVELLAWREALLRSRGQ